MLSTAFTLTAPESRDLRGDVQRRGMIKFFSSARVVPDSSENWNQSRAGAIDTSRLIMFRGRGLHGPSLAVNGAVRNMEEVRFNDAPNSVVVEGGPCLVCCDVQFRGNRQMLNPGGYDDLGSAGLKRSFSSARPVRGERYASR
jgi:hypothetical protein